MTEATKSKIIRKNRKWSQTQCRKNLGKQATDRIQYHAEGVRKRLNGMLQGGGERETKICSQQNTEPEKFRIRQTKQISN